MGAREPQELFRDRLKRAAEYAGVEYSQTAIAKSLGVQKQTVDRWMDASEPRPSMVFHIADTWNVSARWLATGSGDIAPLPPGQGLSAEERELITHIRTSKDPQWKALRLMAAALAKAAAVFVLAIVFSTPQPAQAAAKVFSRNIGPVYYVKRWIKGIFLFASGIYRNVLPQCIRHFAMQRGNSYAGIILTCA